MLAPLQVMRMGIYIGYDSLTRAAFIEREELEALEGQGRLLGYVGTFPVWVPV